MPGILVFAEKTHASLELISLANVLAVESREAVMAVSIPDPDLILALEDQGVDQICILPPSGPGMNIEAYENILISAFRECDPTLILMPSNPPVRNLSARLAEALATGLASDCSAISFDDSNGIFVFDRLIYGGSAVERVKINTRPAIATVPPGLKSIDPANKRNCIIRNIEGVPDTVVKVLECHQSSSERKNLNEATSVICVGRGFDKAEDLAMARELADLLGSELACTRPLSEELNWLPTELCIGLSGQKLKANICLEIGISGQVQHLTGIKDCRCICSINNDENAPVFKASDYGIKGDLYQLLPLLTGCVRQTKNEDP